MVEERENTGYNTEHRCEFNNHPQSTLLRNRSPRVQRMDRPPLIPGAVRSRNPHILIRPPQEISDFIVRLPTLPLLLHPLLHRRTTNPEELRIRVLPTFRNSDDAANQVARISQYHRDVTATRAAIPRSVTSIRSSPADLLLLPHQLIPDILENLPLCGSARRVFETVDYAEK